MITFVLGVADLADTRFAISPVQEAMGSLWALRDPGRHALHLPWRRSVLRELERPGGLDSRLLFALVGDTLTLPDFLTPRPESFAPDLEDQLATIRATPPALVRRDIRATHAPRPVPEVLDRVDAAGDGPVHELLDDLCDLLRRYWRMALEPAWPRMRLVLEADMTYRARQLATGGARLLFADMHPNLRWRDGELEISEMLGRYRTEAAGRGLLLIPSVFTYKPIPPLSADEPPYLTYPSRGIATLWAPPPEPDDTALAALLGAPRATLLRLLEEPMPTVELARRLAVTPSAVSQHLQVLHATGLVSRTRAGRHVLYHRTSLAQRLVS
ncbi:MAG: ArsR family transcriptional regulator [Mycobacteriales bacterium]